jgi:nitrate reductase NapD
MGFGEIHISSIVVHVIPEHLACVKNDISNLPGAEIHGESANGKLVVVLESDTDRQTTDVIDSINLLDHVLSTALVYHHIETPTSEESVL